MQKDGGRWVRIGGKIREHRQHAGLSQEGLARLVALSPTMLSAMERGVRGIKRDHVERIDTALGTAGSLTELWDRSQTTGPPTWYEKVADIERAASEIWVYHPLAVPELLQTEEYAQHLFRVGRPRATPAEIEDLVRGRTSRQAVLDQERPPRLVVVLDEGVLRRPTGGREVMRRQLGHLLAESAKPSVSLQVVPYDSDHHPGLSNGFTLFAVPRRSPVLYVEARHFAKPTEEAEAVEDYVQLFSDLRGAALPLGASRRLVAQLHRELCGGARPGLPPLRF
ncbi:helix-turn-helix transcriptional regulator [Thermobifida alba]|uniref:Helix-turn-helix transcriptional regulator n=1 Tax=Thermobifida alba TaxID=53522 RepID=A0ABY4KYF4_THEAE|nr:helix-turn-helix transcriptional regulator [Thermobifida alba]UPT20095.1 helix-turn-helix transcriptional regulator [Thermobifida alba]HLU97851.1 helix-turn-helix transcriptional regulator [Thermobifida alba]